MRVQITHDFMDVYGGAERVTQEMANAFPEAEVVAILGRESVAERMGVAGRFRSVLPPRRRLLQHYRLLAPALPAVVRAARLPPADVLLSSTYAFAHFFRTANRAPQVCYTHSPLRFAWSMTDSYRDEHAGTGPLARGFEAFAAGMRRVDRHGAQGVERFLTQSPYVADQIQRFYGRPATVVGAPVDCRLFRPSDRPPTHDWLFCGRLIEPYKRVGLVLDAFARLPHLRLRVAGDGPAYAELKDRAPANVEFLGHLKDAELVEAIQESRAAVFPSRDDFGLIPVEVQACGRPVLAYGDGGALYTVRPGVTGELFPSQELEVLVDALARFEPERYDAAVVRAHAEQWDAAAFRARVIDEVRAAAVA